MAKASKEDEKDARRAAGVLLLLVRRSEKSARRSAGEGADRAVAEAVRQDDGGRPAALYASLALVAGGVAGRLQGALLASRQAGREAALRRVTSDLGRLGVEPPAGGFLGAAGAADSVLARVAADSAVTAWQASAYGAVAKAARTEAPVARAVEEQRGRFLRRAELAARDEASAAYSEARREILRDAVARDSAFAARLRRARVVRVWVSALERRTCSRCAGHDGDTTPVGEDFGGDEPGSMHPHCLCTDYLSTEG